MGHRGTQSRYRKVITHFLVTRRRVVTVPSPRTDVSDDKESRSRWEVSTMTIRLLLGRAATWRTARLVPRPLMASDRCRVSNKYSVSYSKCCSNILLRSPNISFSTSPFHFRRDCTRRNELEFPTYIFFLHRVPRSDPGSFSSLDEPCISRKRERETASCFPFQFIDLLELNSKPLDVFERKARVNWQSGRLSSLLSVLERDRPPY